MRSLKLSSVLALAVFSLFGCAMDSSHGPGSHLIVRPGKLEWKPAPPGLPPGSEMAALEGSPAKPGPFTVRVRMPDGYRVPPHWHSRAERITVLSGAFYIASGDTFDPGSAEPLAAGSYTVMPARMKHFAWSKGETVFQLSGEGPFDITYVNPADDPRKAGGGK